MRSSGELERALSMLEGGTPVDDVTASLGLSPKRSEDLHVAAAIRSFADSVPVPPTEEAWALMQPAMWGTPAAMPARVPVRRRRRLPRTLVAVAVAGMLALGSVTAWAAEPGSVLYPVRRGMEKVALVVAPHSSALHLYLARERLANLESALRDGPVAGAPSLASQLVEQQALASRYGADPAALSDLATTIAADVPPLLVPVPPDIADQVRTVLGLPAPQVVTPQPRPTSASTRHHRSNGNGGSSKDTKPKSGSASGGTNGSGGGSIGSGDSQGTTGGGSTTGSSGGGSGDQGSTQGDQGSGSSDQGSGSDQGGQTSQDGSSSGQGSSD